MILGLALSVADGDHSGGGEHGDNTSADAGDNSRVVRLLGGLLVGEGNWLTIGISNLDLSERGLDEVTSVGKGAVDNLLGEVGDDILALPSEFIILILKVNQLVGSAISNFLEVFSPALNHVFKLFWGGTAPGNGDGVRSCLHDARSHDELITDNIAERFAIDRDRIEDEVGHLLLGGSLKLLLPASPFFEGNFPFLSNILEIFADISSHVLKFTLALLDRCLDIFDL